MTEAKKRKVAKDWVYTFDLEQGFPIRVNLYIIKYIYYHIRKAEIFMDVGSGRKPKSFPIYQYVIPISRQRFDRINRGERFQLTAAEANDITEKFGIEFKYFRREAPVLFEISGISETDWKCYYNIEFGCQFPLTGKLTDNKVTERHKKVTDKLAGLCYENPQNPQQKALSEMEPDDSDPLFKVYYYFAHGERYEKEGSVEKAMKALEKVEYADWGKASMEQLEKYGSLMKSHSDLIQAMLLIRDKLK